MANVPAQPPQAFQLNIEEVVGLVKTIYEPGHGRKISQNEATLRVLQRSPQGWEIADALLHNDDEQVRFFGALTFTVKLNSDSAGLTEEDAQQLLCKLINHLIIRPNLSVATRKLCSTLALYFCKPFSNWTQCIRSLAVSFGLQEAVLDDDLDNHPSSWDILPQLSDQQLLVLLEFATNMADETTRLVELPDRKLHGRMVANIENIEVLLQVAFGRGIKYLTTSAEDPNHAQLLELGDKVATSSLRCFTTWIFYAYSEFRDDPEKLRYLRSVNNLAFACLEYHVDDAMDFVADVLERFPKFFEESHQRMLWSAITSPWGMEILKNLDAETVSLAKIIAAYGQMLVDSKKLYLEPDDPHHQEVMAVLHNLLKYPDPVGIDDEVAPIVLEFWTFFINSIYEEAYEMSEADEKPAWLPAAMSNVFLAISEFVQKIVYPPAALDKSWDNDARQTFSAFRHDVRDIFEEAYSILHETILDQFVDLSIRALETSNWTQLEAGLFCLISIHEEVPESADPRLQRLFALPLFTIMSTNAEIPAVTRRIAVELVAAYDSFFLRHPELLPQVLPFLLSALSQASLAHGAAKSFESLCSECKDSLSGELGSFFQMYEQFIGYPTANEFTKSRVLGGIAAIVQAQKSDDQRLAGMKQLFQYVAHDAMQAINVTRDGNDAEQGLVLALTTLKCLSSIGRAMQASDEAVIDLDSDKAPSGYWSEGPGKEIQNQIINFVNYLTQVFPADGEIIEAACNVLRVGFKETVPGPFVLPPSATINYVLKSNIQTPRLPYILETACSWISAYKASKSDEYQIESQRLLRHILTLLQSLQHPRNDPEISESCIELLQKFINTNAAIFSAEQPDVLKGMFDFSVECIRSPEVLPKRAACQLWKDIFELSGSTKSAFQSTGQDIVNHFGPAVTDALIYNVCGEVDGTSLEWITQPLRKCINSDRNAKTNITNALAAQPLIARVGGDPELQGVVRKFIESAMRNAKTNTAFKETIKSFWERCRQMQMQMQFAPNPMHGGHRFAHGVAPAGF